MAVTWNSAFEATPAGSDDAKYGDDKIRELKEAIRERLAHEHGMDLTGGSAATQGWLNLGSAKVYYGASAPTVRPDGVTALTSDDAGRMWVNSSTYAICIYTGTVWTAVASNNLYTETITGDKTFTAFASDSVVTISNSVANAVSITAGAVAAGITLTLIKTTTTATTLTTASGVTFNYTSGSIVVVWTGTSWALKGRANQREIRVLGSGTSWKAPFDGAYDVTVVGLGGTGGTADLVYSTPGSAAYGGGGSSGSVSKRRYVFTSGASCTLYIPSTSDYTTFTDGTTKIYAIPGLTGNTATSNIGTSVYATGALPLSLGWASADLSTADVCVKGNEGGTGSGTVSGYGAPSLSSGVARGFDASVSPYHGANAGRNYGGGGGGAAARYEGGAGTFSGGAGGPAAVIIEF